MKQYDVIVIGGGPAGYAAAMRAVDFKKRVALVEKDKLGGAGIHNGALWSKTWWEIAREASILTRHSGMFGMQKPNFNFEAIKAEVSDAIQQRVDLLEHHLYNINVHSDTDLLDFYHGSAKLIDDHEVIVRFNGDIEHIRGENIILATGSRPRKLDHLPIDEQHVFTSDGLSKLESFPESMVILGAGVIGCEFATIFSSFGHTKVFIIDKGDRILPFEDPDIVSIIEKNLELRGVHIHRNSRLIDMKIKNERVHYTLEFDDGGKEVFIVEKALISIGRVPNYEDLFDQNVPITMDKRGIIDEMTKTSVSNIYAVGDITADISLVNVGEVEARYAVESMFGQPEKPLIYENISTIMFLCPEVAGVGKNELQAQKEELDYKVVSLEYSLIPRATAMRNTDGFIKILVTDDDEMNILGMRVIGQHASSAIQAVALLIAKGQSIKELAELIHPHPSIIEGIQECCRMLLGKSILKPSVLRSAMKCKHYRNGQYEDLLFE